MTQEQAQILVNQITKAVDILNFWNQIVMAGIVIGIGYIVAEIVVLIMTLKNLKRFHGE